MYADPMTMPAPVAGTPTNLSGGVVETVEADGTVTVKSLQSRTVWGSVPIGVDLAPVVGDRVLVGFIDGDPQRPTVLSALTGKPASPFIENLYIQEARPSNPNPLGSLWIPLNADGTPQPSTTWEVYTGGGTITGPTRLYVQVDQPTNPQIGSLWIPLNADGTPQTAWQVYG